ncbi:MAG: PilZ domain-containing protein [Myxococcota bacterium]
MPNSESTRRHQRVPLRVPVDVSTIDPELDPRTGRPYFRSCQEHCGNLSTGGMFIHTAEPPTPGRRLLVRFHTPDGLAVETLARVAWRGRSPGPGPSEKGVGVEFIEASAATRAALERIVERSPQPRGD